MSIAAGLGTPANRLFAALRAALDSGTPTTTEVADRLLLSPSLLRRHLERQYSDRIGRLRVTGTLDRRLVLIERTDRRWVIADLSGQPHASRRWPEWLTGHITIENPDSWISRAEVDDYAAHRFTRPRVLVTALYHPEYFPLPRFPLGISDVARAVRSTLIGDVDLRDMQLGVTLAELLDQVTADSPDILGISATFGQHDLMTELLDITYRLPSPPLVVAGGSLTARNEGLLLKTYPELLIARGAGEPTIKDVLRYWHGDIRLDEIQGIGYNGGSRGTGVLGIARRRTAKPVSSSQDEIFPELDLLPATLEVRGVGQAETSRGCTNFCSFCPRGHKGQWHGAEPELFPWFLGAVGQIYDDFPHVSRTLYLVDEEFIGRGLDAVPRALDMAHTLHDAGFKWETSCRIDQVTRPDRDRAWHTERATMWRTLQDRGLRRCLFGVESGVDSILTRFNKETTGEQNAQAIRTLSALGVPTRFTYISFDQLMTPEELRATYEYQGRTDLLLRPLPDVPVEEIVEGVQDPQWVAAHSTGRPFHSAISYMLVSMECLIGAAYTRQASAAGLTGEERPSMGRVDSRFADWRIGVASEWAQLWVDRNFALDYTFKSLEKVLEGTPWQAVRGARVVLKDAAYTVFGHLLRSIEDTPVAIGAYSGTTALSTRLRGLLDVEIGGLRERMADVTGEVTRALPREHAQVLEYEHRRWQQADDWRSINASDPCGT
ncbi:radical SAM protein [Streptomyces sp. NBC_00102]|uniref:B12-binding domain-containing radical SAM protein n=1 Tax=Streptomyces sp. NBC_00102 TaxID=2975652 RepID=UPI002256B705|nr:radical SAM protein [Streptomyces sp. NBC_00102]MCX5402284.1 radical SAM protein [Streptomyces sp. NBC_00102]